MHRTVGVVSPGEVPHNLPHPVRRRPRVPPLLTSREISWQT